MVINPVRRYDLGEGLELGVPRGTQWWNPVTPVKCKVSNISPANVRLQQGVVVATVYAVNDFDHDRMNSPMEPVEDALVPLTGGRTGPDKATGGAKQAPSSVAPRVDLAEANMGNLIPLEKATL